MTSFCCDSMTAQVNFDCVQHPDPLGCPDKVLNYVPNFNEYGLLIRDGEDGYASSHIVIAFCPWCGAGLGPSYRYAWFDKLDAVGLEPEDDLPAELTDATWWQREEPSSDPEGTHQRRLLISRGS